MPNTSDVGRRGRSNCLADLREGRVAVSVCAKFERDRGRVGGRNVHIATIKWISTCCTERLPAERNRLREAILYWLNDKEKNRGTPFRVEHVEEKKTVEINGLQLRLRVWRMG